MIISNGVIITPEGELKGKALEIKDRKIVSIMDERDVSPSQHSIVDAQNGYILPGFIDIHTHGGAGSDVMDAAYEDYINISKFHASHGVTGILATTLTAPLKEIIRCLQEIREVCGKDTGGCKILGVHLEGPFLSPENKGAHIVDFLLQPIEGAYNGLLEYSDIIKMITVAPELPGAIHMIDELKSKNITVSGGHDYAVDQDILKAIEHGMTHTTHAFCVMSTITRRSGIKYMGMCEMMLLDDRLTTEIVADNRHTPPLLVKLIYKCKGPKKMCIVSDCLRAAGMPEDGRLYRIGSRDAQKAQEIVVDDGVAKLPDRSINAGSITTLDGMVRNLVNDCGIPFVEAVRMASLTPAEIIGMGKHKGSLEINKDADICIMDRHLKVKKTFVEGVLVYSDVVVA